VSFLIFIDKLAKLLEHHGVVVKLFADDIKVYPEICNVDDAVKLQKALDLIVEWADDWQLAISIDKCNALSIGKRQDITQYYINGTELPCLPIAENWVLQLPQTYLPQFISSRSQPRPISVPIASCDASCLVTLHY